MHFEEMLMIVPFEEKNQKHPARLKIAWLAVVLALAGIVMATSLAKAQDAKPTPSDDQVNAVARGLYCPVCENIPLDVCPTQACAQWRELIREKLSQGWSDQQIKDYFVTQYGDRVLAEPPRRGLNWLVYILPPLIILVGAYILYRFMRNAWVRKPPAAEQPHATQPESPQDEYVQQLEAELKKRG